jgi:hypothetical protein
MTKPRRIPNTWTSQGEPVPVSARLRQAISSRHTGGASAPTGTTHPLRRRYYTGILDLARTLRRRRRLGEDVEQALWGMGSVYVRRLDGTFDQIRGPDAVLLLGRVSDISPHHFREPKRARMEPP